MEIILSDAELNFKEVFIIGSKMPIENEFYLQVVDTDKKMNRLKSYFLGKGDNIQFFILPVNCPVYMASKITFEQVKQAIKEKAVIAETEKSKEWKPLPINFEI